jgi:predicted transposase/invertase (TIGR01784 family)
MQFLDVKTDYAFKKVFGSEQSKSILISFLNALLDFNGEKITELTIVDPYQIPLLQGMKDTFVDVKAVLSNQTKVIIEMQVLNVEGFEKRILYNAAKSYSTQLLKGEKYHLLNPVVALTITDFVMFDDLKDIMSTFKLLEKNHLINYSDDIQLVFVELPKFNKSDQELTNITDKWLYFIKNAGSLEYIPETLQNNQEIQQAFTIANTASLSRAELELQEKRHDFIRLQQGSIELAHSQGVQQGLQQGVQQGLQQGLQQGKEETRLEIAKNLLAAGLEMSLIIKSTGFSQPELETIKKREG